MRTVAAVVAASLLALLGAACDPPALAPPPAGACRTDPFTAEARAWLDLRAGPRNHLTAAVWDLRTGCWYHYRPGQVVTTASVVKLEMLGALLRRAQAQGRSLTLAEWRSLIPMITRSDNATASRLWTSLGGEPGMERAGADLGLAATDEVGPVWGLTRTTAEDQARFAGRLLGTAELLDDRRRADAWWVASNVVPAQRWGVGAGLPPGWAAGMKNGFASSRCCRWRINSVGFVADPAGGGYAVAVLSDGWATMAEGVRAVDAVGRVVNGALAR